MDAFLSQGERVQIQRMYKKWLDNLRPDELATELYVRDMMKTRDKQKYDILQTPYSKNELLFDVALQRITYDHLMKVRRLLVQTEQVELARLLPVRTGDTYWETYARECEKKRQDAEAEQMQRRRERERKAIDNRSQGQQRRPTSPMETEPYHVQENVHEQQLKSTSDQPHTTMSATDVSTVPAARPVDSERPQGLPEYKFKPNNLPTGKGFCLIIANYTNQLEGYTKDIEKITHFFRGVLRYKVRAERDIKQAKMRQVLDDTRDELKNDENYDRLFVFVLSHGTNEGIQTCMPDGRYDEIIHGKKQFIKPEEVVSHFTHDNLPSLKDFPKVFFFQICRGVGLAQAAAGDNGAASPGGIATSDSMEGELAECAAGADRIAIGADTLVCYASPAGFYSWVDKQSGSWLINVAMDVFEEHYESEHLVDMITQVNKKISTKKQKAQVNGVIKDVCQIPCIKHNLTRKLFLHNT